MDAFLWGNLRTRQAPAVVLHSQLMWARVREWSALTSHQAKLTYGTLNSPPRWEDVGFLLVGEKSRELFADNIWSIIVIKWLHVEGKSENKCIWVIFDFLYWLVFLLWHERSLSVARLMYTFVIYMDTRTLLQFCLPVFPGCLSSLVDPGCFINILFWSSLPLEHQTL